MSHINEKIDFTVSAYIVCKDRVLLRFHEKNHIWIVPGGHIELGEGPIEALHREVMEETGLEITIIAEPGKKYGDGPEDIQTPIFINRHTTNQSGHEHINLVYAAETQSMEINQSEGEITKPEHFRWLTAQEVESSQDLLDHVKHHALTALKKVQNH